MSPRSRTPSRRDAPPPGPPSDLVPKATFLDQARRLFESLTRPVVEGRTARTSGRELASRYTRAVDTIVGMLFQRAAHRHGLSPDDVEMAVIAMGGYGRAELAPYSDVDVLVVCRRRTRAVDAVASSFTRLLWDFGFEPGHAVESLVESESALAEDPDTRTALIESRWVCGSRRVARALARQIARIRRRDREPYLRRKIADACARHERFGHSYQLIEPDVKLAPGGMRDYHTLVWMGQVMGREPGLRMLERRGLLLRGERAELEAAYDFLLRLRIEMHLAAGMRQDRLTVDLQRRVAPALGFRDRGERLAVEYFMRRLYTHMRAVFRITDDCLEEVGRGDDVRRLFARRPRRAGPGVLNVAVRRDRLERDPLYVFRIQKETGQRLDRGLRRRLVRALDVHLRGAGSLSRMRRGFLDLLADDRHVARVVRSLHDTLFLMRIVPEYQRLTCLKEYDLYHHYTVDEHSFKVLEHLASLGEAGADATDPFVRLYSEIDDRRALFLAALLHDVGKIAGSDHARSGAEMARRILRRLRADEALVERVAFLVRHHLVMSHYSQRRDPADLGTLRAFCRTVRDRSMLKHLCLLTWADYRATSPEVWTEWKRTLLWDLYVRAYAYMTRAGKRPEAEYRRRKRRILDGFAEGPERDRALAHLDRLPGGYLLAMDASRVAGHMAMVDALVRERIVVSHRRLGEAVEVTVVTRDAPGLLSTLCGALTVCDLDILHAWAFTRDDGVVIDVFAARPVAGELDDDALAGRVACVRSTLESIAADRVDLAREVARHARRWARRRRRGAMPVAPQVRFENDVSTDFTIVDVVAADRPGLLYHVTRSLSEAGLVIRRATISTEAHRAVDAFYVAEADGSKVDDAERLREIRARVDAAIDQSSDRDSTRW